LQNYALPQANTAALLNVATGFASPLFTPQKMTFAVVIPAYNAARTLARAIDSVLAQTYPPAEIWVIDDASTDGTLALAASYSPKVQLIQLPHNQGPSAARNAGWDAAAADYIAFLDADDAWHPLKLELVARHLAQTPGIRFLGHRILLARFSRQKCLRKPGLPHVRFCLSYSKTLILRRALWCNVASHCVLTLHSGTSKTTRWHWLQPHWGPAITCRFHSFSWGAHSYRPGACRGTDGPCAKANCGYTPLSPNEGPFCCRFCRYCGAIAC
jgi:Glycosyl transferase family 2